MFVADSPMLAVGVATPSFTLSSTDSKFAIASFSASVTVTTPGTLALVATPLIF